MAEQQSKSGGLEKFRVSSSIRNVLGAVSLYATTGMVGVEEFFRGAVYYGQKNANAASATFLHRILSEPPRTDKFATAFRPPNSEDMRGARSSGAQAELIEAFEYAVSIRRQTGGKDNVLGLRHVLFSLTAFAEVD
jgi:hypothetical protein